MRDNMKPCQHTLSDDVVYKDVVVIGNGPSGMVTSFMLAGNVPHLKPIPDDLPIDDMLKIRLQNLPTGQNLLEADLTALAEGLEGRSQNPIALLSSPTSPEDALIAGDLFGVEYKDWRNYKLNPTDSPAFRGV
ncbi:jg21784 [Pararge aegeria aegeria]|uniref:Jg21784 protein n=1 Tax=Pararge aegeria aegeria TaxID=348720 RepID=A0A8S4R5M6_9NEOP|nr:jg21784 [Pararge aegeria aegeria]